MGVVGGHYIPAIPFVDPNSCHLQACQAKLHGNQRRKCFFWSFWVPSFWRKELGEITSFQWPSLKPIIMTVINFPGHTMQQPEAKMRFYDHLRISNFGGLAITTLHQRPLCRGSSRCNMKFVCCITQPQCIHITDRQITDIMMPTPTLCTMQRAAKTLVTSKLCYNISNLLMVIAESFIQQHSNEVVVFLLIL
jgi:hypothetical protein